MHPAVCTSCASDWTSGAHTEGCAECGGGAMEMPCPHCEGACGIRWKRMVLDSNDSREAHWVGGCAATCATCGAKWGQHAFGGGCDECGGGGIARPCPDCGGACGELRLRDVRQSWALHQARWRGACGNAQ